MNDRRLALSIASMVAVLAFGLTSMGTAAAVAPHAQAPAAPAASKARGNGLIAFTTNRDGNDEVYTMNLDGTDPVDITNDPGTDTSAAWSTAGTQIAFVSDRSGNRDVYTANPDGSNPVDITNDAHDDAQPSWSPTTKQGTFVVFASNRTGNEEIFRTTSTGSTTSNLTKNTANDTEPAYSPDGKKIAFVSDRSGNADIWVMNANGSGAVDLTNATSADTDPVWSPDGTKIAFTSDRSGTPNVWLMNADGSGAANVTISTTASDTHPAFAPDAGLRILFQTGQSGSSEVYWTNAPGSTTLNAQGNLTQNPADDSQPAWQPLVASAQVPSKIKHVVVIYQENKAFDNVFAHYCDQVAQGLIVRDPCAYSLTGELHDGTVIDLPPAADIAPSVPHAGGTALVAMNGGLMNGFDTEGKCDASTGYQCYQAYQPSQMPNEAALATTFAISDHTFMSFPAGSWGSHLELASSYLDGFGLANHHREITTGVNGWGCDSGVVGQWSATPGADGTNYPTCIPQKDGTGPFRASPVPWAPSIMDRMDAAGKTWHLYAPLANDSSYGWSICPTFSDCLYTGQTQNWTTQDQFFTDAANGTLANLSYVIPEGPNSQHNGSSMLAGDNWIGSLVSAVENGPDWSSTAIFVTWDDCGCFYDHMAPPPGAPYGIRAPFMIISPWAKPGYTDTNVATFNSMLAFTEHTFGLAPLSTWDGEAYDYANAFDFTHHQISPIQMTTSAIPAWEIRWMKAHPLDMNDPN